MCIEVLAAWLEGLPVCIEVLAASLEDRVALRMSKERLGEERRSAWDRERTPDHP